MGITPIIHVCKAIPVPIILISIVGIFISTGLSLHTSLMERKVDGYLLAAIVKNQRHVYKDFKIQTGLNRCDIEMLVFADSKPIFSLYEVGKHFSCLNVQHARRTIKKLVGLNGLEMLNQGIKNKPSLYCIHPNGKNFIQIFNQLWGEILETD